jgi:hypothetical protein
VPTISSGTSTCCSGCAPRRDRDVAHVGSLDLRRLFSATDDHRLHAAKGDADEKARLARGRVERLAVDRERSGARLVDRTFTLDEAGEAHRWLERGSQFGKVVLVPGAGL